MKAILSASKKNIHVAPLGNGWIVRKETGKNFIVITGTKREAVSVARAVAKSNHSILVVHGKDGQVTEKSSYILNTNYQSVVHTTSRVSEPAANSYSRISQSRKKK